MGPRSKPVLPLNEDIIVILVFCPRLILFLDILLDSFSQKRNLNKLKANLNYQNDTHTMPSMTSHKLVVLMQLLLLQQQVQHSHASSSTTITSSTTTSNSLCLLCENGVAGLQYPYAVIQHDGTTCVELAMDLATSDYPSDSEGCIQNLQGWRQICCGDDRPIDVEITEPRVFDQYPDIDSIETIGPYQTCDLCRDGDYPSVSSMVLTMLYIGSGTCPQYWKAGQQGLIPTHLCDPLRYFAYEPCGCGEFSTNGNYHWEGAVSDSSNTNDQSSSSSSSSSSTNDNNGYYDDDIGEADWWSGADSMGGGDLDIESDDEWWMVADSWGKGSQASPLTSMQLITTAALLVGMTMALL